MRKSTSVCVYIVWVAIWLWPVAGAVPSDRCPFYVYTKRHQNEKKSTFFLIFCRAHRNACCWWWWCSCCRSSVLFICYIGEWLWFIVYILKGARLSFEFVFARAKCYHRQYIAGWLAGWPAHLCTKNPTITNTQPHSRITDTKGIGYARRFRLGPGSSTFYATVWYIPLVYDVRSIRIHWCTCRAP